MARAKITLDHAGIQHYLDGGGGVGELLNGMAERVLGAARNDPHDATGNYEDSLHVWEDHTDRLVARVGSDVDYAMVLEANYGILARALDSA